MVARLAAMGIVVLSVCHVSAEAPLWTFSPSKVGRALHEGQWMVEYRLAAINATPEFRFPPSVDQS
jgi:hypothetical protein